MKPVIPKPFKERVEQIVDDPLKFYKYLSKPLPRAFRVNTLKTDSETVEKSLKGCGLKIRNVPWSDTAFIVDDEEIGSTIEHFMGHVYIQELVSMLPPLILKSEIVKTKEPVILDACAAPGSKTTQLSALMGNKGLLIANDSSFGRIKILKHNLEKSGCMNVVVINKDTRYLKNGFKFDFIILDAPCSSEGIVRKNPNILSYWSLKKVKWLSGMQKQMIVNCYDLLKPGGLMVYSTCTYAPEENEGVVSHLVDKRECRLEPVKIKYLETSGPLGEWEGKAFSKTKKAVRIWPHHNDTGGFFIAKIRKGENGA